MTLFNKKPKCDNTAYIEEMFKAIENSYSDKDFVVETLDFKDIQFPDFIEFNTIIQAYASKLNLKILIKKIDEIYAYDFSVPIIYRFSQEDDISTIQLTPFALENLNITLSEIILLITDIKITKDGYFEFQDEFFEDYEFSYRPFLTAVSVYFGFGIQLLKRCWVTGVYEFKNVDKVCKFKYFVPLELNCLIYSQAVVLAKKQLSATEFVDNLNKEIKKELIVCQNYINKMQKKSKSVNNELTNFIWKKK